MSAFFWRFWFNPDAVGGWQGPNGQAMGEKWRGLALEAALAYAARQADHAVLQPT